MWREDSDDENVMRGENYMAKHNNMRITKKIYQDKFASKNVSFLEEPSKMDFKIQNSVNNTKIRGRKDFLKYLIEAKKKKPIWKSRTPLAIHDWTLIGNIGEPI